MACPAGDAHRVERLRLDRLVLRVCDEASIAHFPGIQIVMPSTAEDAAGLLWSASAIFSSMEFAFTQIFGTKQRDMLRQKAMGLVMMLLLVVAVAACADTAAAGNHRIHAVIQQVA